MANQGYRFPLSDQDDYKAKIMFRVLSEDTKTINFLNANTPTSSGNFFENFVNNFLTIVNNSANYDGSKGGSCMLYMPSALQMQDGVSFDNVALGASGVAALQTVNDAQSTMQQAGEMLKATAGLTGISAILDAAKANKDVGGVVMSKLSGLAGDRAGAIASNATQTAVNPNTRATFKTVNHREHSFQFKFLPRNVEEGREIENIVKFFRTELYPESIQVGDISVGYKFPNKFAIQMLYNGKQIGQRLLPAFLRSVSTTYNGTSQSFYKDGKFSEIDLSLNFIEHVTMSRDDITYDLDPIGGNYKEWWQTFLDTQIAETSHLPNANAQSGVQ